MKRTFFCNQAFPVIFDSHRYACSGFLQSPPF